MDRACNTCNTCNTVFIDNSFYILYRADIQGQIADVYMSTYLLPIFGVTEVTEVTSFIHAGSSVTR